MSTFNDRELATVLASLRLFQRERKSVEHFPHFTFTGASPLTDRQIDLLVERLNAAPTREELRALTEDR